MPLFGCLCYTMWAMPLCNACLFCIRSLLAGNKQSGSWSCFACHSHETIGGAFLPRQQSTGSAQRRGSPLTVGLPYIFCHTSYQNLASFASFPASCHCMFRAGRVYAEELDAGPSCRFRTVCLAREDVYLGALWRERRVISAGEMAGGRVSFSDTTGYLSEIRVQF